MSDNKPLKSEYKVRYVAFLDLQGIASQVESLSRDLSNFDKVAGVLYSMKRLEDKSKKRIIFQSIPGISESEIDSLVEGFQCTVISDSIIISYPATSKYALDMLILEIGLMQWALLWKWEYLLRGYIAIGLCYHKEGIIFGEGYQKAFACSEKDKKHKMPKVRIDELIAGPYIPKRPIEDNVFLDEDGKHFINFRSLIKNAPYDKSTESNAVQQFAQAEAFVKKNLNDPNLDNYIKSKYQWTLDYLMNEEDGLHQPKSSKT